MFFEDKPSTITVQIHGKNKNFVSPFHVGILDAMDEKGMESSGKLCQAFLMAVRAASWSDVSILIPDGS